MKKLLFTALAALSFNAYAADLTGAGATFPYPIYAKWAEAYKAATGIGLNYQSIGSGGGIRQIKAKTVDFGASDMPLKPEELDKEGLVQFPAIIGGVVPKKIMNWESISEAVKHGVPSDMLSKFSGEFNLALMPGQDQPEDFTKSFEVSHIGTGMMIIKRSVFEKLKSSAREYTYTGSGILGANPGDKMNEYWNTNISDKGTLMGEDVNFCYMWRKLGGKVYAAPYAKTTHVGSYEFSGTLNP